MNILRSNSYYMNIVAELRVLPEVYNEICHNAAVKLFSLLVFDLYLFISLQYGFAYKIILVSFRQLTLSEKTVRVH